MGYVKLLNNAKDQLIGDALVIIDNYQLIITKSCYYVENQAHLYIAI